MSRNYWFGVVCGEDLRQSEITKSWWCLPYNATEDDAILLYCPRSVSTRKQGIFAEARVLVTPHEKREENSYCTGYGFLGSPRLAYAEIEITERFAPNLTAKHMKADPIIRQADLVRRNFQGTTFAIEFEVYQRMKSLLIQLAKPADYSER